MPPWEIPGNVREFDEDWRVATLEVTSRCSKHSHLGTFDKSVSLVCAAVFAASSELTCLARFSVLNCTEWQLLRFRMRHLYALTLAYYSSFS